MIDPNIIFQRTQAGRDEIKQKTHGLTQSERLVLIMVDGVTSYQGIRGKLPVLTDERFDRALQKLQLKELVLEVFMPVEGQAPDELERTVIDRFLQQDPLDPVTIILRDPEEELEMIGMRTAHRTAPPVPAPSLAPTPAPIPAIAPSEPDPVPELQQEIKPVVPARPEPAIDEHHAKLADSLAAELRARKPLRANPMPQTEPPPMPPAAPDSHSVLAPLAAVHWGYWAIVAGASFILGFALARVTA